MKTRFIILAVFFIFSCRPDKNLPGVENFDVGLNSNTIYADGFDELQVKVTDETGADITSSATILINGQPITGSVFTTHTAGRITVRARINEKESEEKSITALNHAVNNFSKKLLIEEYAGAWCGFCPRVNRLVDSFVSADPLIIPVSIHNGDPLEYIFEQQMRSHFGITGFPSIYFNRFMLWDESAAAVMNELNRKSKCGLAIQSTVSGNTIFATVKIKFDVSTSVPLQLVVMLTEDSIILPQNNLFDNTPASPFFMAGNPIQQYRHNHVLRSAATDIFGDSIPESAQIKNNLYEKKFSFNATGYTIANTKILAFVKFRENTVTRFGVLNIQSVNTGQSKNFD